MSIGEAVSGVFTHMLHAIGGWRSFGGAYQDGNLELPKIAQRRAEPPAPVHASP